MKSLFLTLILIFALVGLAFAGTSNITFQWDANTEPDLAGYRLYQSTTPGVYVYGQGNEVADIPAPATTKTITVESGNYYWVLTAYDTEGLESEPSNEVTIAPSAPRNLRITIIVEGL